MSKLSIIIPCYYNEDNIPVTLAELFNLEDKYPSGTMIEYVMIDDGSKDTTLKILEEYQKKYSDKIKVLKLARNFGSYNAIQAGLNYATGDCCLVIAADLQDPPELIPVLFKHWQNGFKLVLAQRTNRDDGLFNNLFSNIYHLVVRKFALPNSPKGGFDFWLFDKQLKNMVIEMDEKNCFLPYLFIWMGFEYVSVPYERQKREIGKSRWTFSKKLKSFVDSLVSFTYLPLRMISLLGFVFGLIAIVYSLIILYNLIYNKIPVEGWSSLMLVLLAVSSFIMISLGIIGEYLWRTLDATRKRPVYIIDKVIDETKNGN